MAKKDKDKEVLDSLDKVKEEVQWSLVRAAKDLLRLGVTEEKMVVLRLVLSNFDPQPNDVEEEPDIKF